MLESALLFPLLVLQSRQLYGLRLPPGPPAIDVKSRVCRPFGGKDMVYDRQRYALNDTVVRYDVAAVGKFVVANGTFPSLLDDLSVQQLPHLSW